jgi:hypothetical protein
LNLIINTRTTIYQLSVQYLYFFYSIEINGRGLPTSGGRGRPFLLSLDS